MRYFLSLLSFLVVACSSAPDKELKNPSKSELAALIPPNMRALEGDGDEFPAFNTPDGVESTVNAHLGNGGGSAPPAPGYLPPLPNAEDLVWTDPDNPDQDLGVVEQAFTKPVNDPWQSSYRSAQRLSYAQGKPLMIWFTDSRRSPICKALSADLFARKDFEIWSEEKVIKLRVDLNPKESDQKKFRTKQQYAQALRKKFGVKGNPVVVVIGNDGSTAGRYVGYRRGEGDYYFGRIKNAVATSEEEHFDWWTKMKAKGYRLWTGGNGTELYAKLLKYRDGKLQVVEPNGRKTFFNEKNLSAKDRQWVKKRLAESKQS